MNEDRRVHASHPAGEEVVRYDRAGKWYIELVPPSPDAGSRRQIGVKVAASEALAILQQGGQVHFGLHGGGTFDRLVREYEADLEYVQESAL